MPRAPRYDEPFFWWGPGWETHASHDIGDLLRDGTIGTDSAALLWAALARRRSLAVIGGPSGLGKSTLLWALRRFLPPDTRQLFVRGCFETFDFLTDPGVDPRRSALLINEISPHLPIYTWGPAVGAALEAAERGFSLLATAHAESAVEFVSHLTGSPLRIAAARTAAFEYVVLLEPSAITASGRLVTRVWRLTPSASGVTLDVVDLGAAGPGQDHVSPVATPLPAAEIRQRREILTRYRDGIILDLPATIEPDDPHESVDTAGDWPELP